MKYKLKDIFDLQMGKTPSRNNQDYWNTDENKWISIADLSKNEKYIKETKEFTALGYSVSIGYSDVDLYENNAFERALARADEKMYQMKEEKQYKKTSV